MRQDLDRKMLASVREYNLIGVPFYITINPNQQHSYMFIFFRQFIMLSHFQNRPEKLLK